MSFQDPISSFEEDAPEGYSSFRISFRRLVGSSLHTVSSV